MPDLIIIGNSGAARECYWLARECMRAGARFEFKGFLALDGYPDNLKGLAAWSLGNDDAYEPAPDDIFAIGIGAPALRRRAYRKWRRRGAVFTNLVHPAARIVGDVNLGDANIIACNSYISCDASLGCANYLNGSVTVAHDVKIGDFNFFAPFSMALGGATVGNGNNFGVYAVLLPGARVGDDNVIAPGAYLYKGCGSNALLAGNPALKMGAAP